MASKALLLSAAFAAVQMAAGQNAASKLLQMRKLTSGGNIATLTDATFDELVRSPNRPYHTFVIFNAKDAAYQCQLCGPFESEIQILADSWEKQRAADPSAEAPDIFFARADISNCRSIFSDYDLQQAPVLVHFGPTGGAPHNKKRFPPNAQYVSELDAENTALFVREKTDVKIEIQRPMWGKILAAVIFLALLSFLVIFAGEHVIAMFLRVREFTLLGLVAGVAIYYIAVSGVLYDIIRGVPPFGYDPKSRRAIFISNQSGTQYGVEGLIIGALNVAAALCIILLTTVFPKLSSPESRNYASGAAGVLFLFFFYNVYMLYNYKNPWYTISMLVRG